MIIKHSTLDQGNKRLREENELLHNANAEAAKTIATLREENERLKGERGVFLTAGLSSTDALSKNGLNMLQVGIAETLEEIPRLREENELLRGRLLVWSGAWAEYREAYEHKGGSHLSTGACWKRLTQLSEGVRKRESGEVE